MEEKCAKVLSINSGSSSIKFELFDMRTCVSLAAGLLERIGDKAGQQTYRLNRADGSVDKTVEAITLSDHQEGAQRIAHWLTGSGVIAEASQLAGIAHRVAHGGTELNQPTVINKQVLDVIARLIPLAPLHNPANLRGIEVTLSLWPDTPQVAIFDTAFHNTIPAHAYTYALPRDLAQTHSIRRYGFHGTSHQYVAQEAARLLGRPMDQVNLIVLHLGNGASVTAIRAGKSIDTSMGLTPLEGLMMGTRCGDIDPGVLLHLTRVAGVSTSEMDAVLNKSSGLQGVCGDNDMREVLRRVAAGDSQATLAVEMYTYRIKKYIGAYAAILPRLDALVFTAGIGEHSAEIRARVCGDLQHLGITVASKENVAQQQGCFEISEDDSNVKVLVIPTNEELEMAKQAWQCISGR